jgi:mono/diheme cytochrome c family protein
MVLRYLSGKEASLYPKGYRWDGSAGTSMIGFAGQLTDEEIWAIIQYERTFSLHQGRGMRGMGDRGPMGHRGILRGHGRRAHGAE